MLVTVEPGKDFVYPTNGATEPAVGGDGLAAEAEYELTELVLAERQPYVHEEDVFIAAGVGVFDGMPDGKFSGMHPCE